MHQSGHIGLGLLFGAPFSFVAGVFGGRGWMLFIYAPALMMALFPDNDVAIPLVKHRGITHTLTLGIPVSIGVGGFFGVLATSTYGSITIGFLLGILAAVAGFFSHLVGDALTVGSGKYGITPLWPISSWEFRIGVTRSNSILWNMGLLSVGIAAVFGTLSAVRAVMTQ